MSTQLELDAARFNALIGLDGDSIVLALAAHEAAYLTVLADEALERKAAAKKAELAGMTPNAVVAAVNDTWPDSPWSIGTTTKGKPRVAVSIFNKSFFGDGDSLGEAYADLVERVNARTESR